MNCKIMNLLRRKRSINQSRYIYLNGNGTIGDDSLLFGLLPLLCKLLLFGPPLPGVMLLLLIFVLLLLLLGVRWGDGDRDFRVVFSSVGKPVWAAYGADGLNDDSRFVEKSNKLWRVSLSFPFRNLLWPSGFNESDDKRNALAISVW